jgi:hypothetical protein
LDDEEVKELFDEIEYIPRVSFVPTIYHFDDETMKIAEDKHTPL